MDKQLMLICAPVTLTTIGVPTVKASQLPNPNPSLEAKFI